jgi:hypothetical protein
VRGPHLRRGGEVVGERGVGFDGDDLVVLRPYLGRNALSGQGNTNPRRVYSQQQAIELTQDGSTWISQRLEAKFEEYGKIQPATLNSLDWPMVRS